MTAEENAALLRRAHEAFEAQDLPAAVSMFAEEAAWHVPGDGALAGVKQGRDSVLEYCMALLSRAADVLWLDLHDVVAGDDHGVSLLHQHAERDGVVFDQHLVLVAHIEAGRFTEVWEFHENTAEYDAFWG